MSSPWSCDEIRKCEKRKGKEIRKEKKEITPSREKVVTDYNRDDTEKGVCDSLLIAHLLCAEPVTPQCLDLWPNGDGCY